MHATSTHTAIDHLAFEPFFRSEFPRIVRDIQVIVTNREVAKELAQEAFARAALRWSSVGQYDRPEFWVRRVAIRLAVRSRDRRIKEIESFAVPATRPDLSVEHLDLRRAVAMLPRQQKAAIVLHYFYGMPVKQVAKALGCRATTADVHLHRARRRLATVLTNGNELL